MHSLDMMISATRTAAIDNAAGVRNAIAADAGAARKRIDLFL
jgi:hypothetical protein